jgi:hypothetical protein
MARYRLVVIGCGTEVTFGATFRSELDAIYFYNEELHSIDDTFRFHRTYLDRRRSSGSNVLLALGSLLCLLGAIHALFNY